MTNNTILKFELTIDETNAIIAGLNELAAKIANPIIDKLVKEANRQLTPEAPAEQPAANT